MELYHHPVDSIVVQVIFRQALRVNPGEMSFNVGRIGQIYTASPILLQSKNAPGSVLRPGAMSSCPTIRSRDSMG